LADNDFAYLIDFGIRPRRERHRVDVRGVDHRHLGLHGPPSASRPATSNPVLTSTPSPACSTNASPASHPSPARPSSRSRWATWSLRPPEPPKQATPFREDWTG
jgi:hypothetical protein